MKFTEKLDAAVKKNNSLLCIGLDIDLKKIPASLLNKGDPIFDFNKAIIDATKDLVCAYKPNIAFYEMYGVYGMQALIKTIEYASDQALDVIECLLAGDLRRAVPTDLVDELRALTARHGATMDDFMCVLHITC